MRIPALLSLIVLSAMSAAALAAPFQVTARPFVWQQAERELKFHFFIERELYTSLDRTARMVFATETGTTSHKLATMEVHWAIRNDGGIVASGAESLAQGGVDVTFALSQLKPGRYQVTARLMSGRDVVAESFGDLRYELRDTPAQAGRVALQLPRGVPLMADGGAGGWPVHAGVPFPKGVLWNANHVRVVDAAGKPVDADVLVRGRWGSGDDASIRWLGVLFQPGSAEASWPSGQSQYHLEFGPQIARDKPTAQLKVTDADPGITIDTGSARLFINRKKFNVIDQWTTAAGQSFRSTARHGLYVVDHKGMTYLAANDRDVKVSVEEQSAMHVVVRAEGWYVRDRAPDPPVQNFTLPTDKLCRFVTRIEAYAGRPEVRVVNTLIITFDTFTVRLRDAGMSLPIPGGADVAEAKFGIEAPAGAMSDTPPFQGGAGGGSGDQSPAAAVTSPAVAGSTRSQPLTTREEGDAAGTIVHAVPVTPTGVRGVQHRHDAFTIEDGEGQSLAEAKRSAGWVVAAGRTAALAISHRDTWQRYPKEFEVLPNAVKLHVWPAHGREHPEINEVARDQIHKLWFAHQGRELNMATPWDYFLAACNFYSKDSFDVYEAPGHVIAAVHATGMGVATTSDVMLQLGAAADEAALIAKAECFQLAPHAVADPKWTCASLALGYIHPYDPVMFPSIEETISNGMRGYWQAQDMGEMFGMWIYRSWLHSNYLGNGAWELARLYNGTHHHEAILPWLFYARSGDPFYLTQGMANIRQLTDVQMIHHTDPRAGNKEFHGGQGQLVGSTKHDDCIAPWGNDHGIMGHMTCYNAAITGYYLTGDLRLREVVVDEWLNTVVADRRNPEYAMADRSNTVFAVNPRDNSVAIGEVIDAYQLTYDPRLLAYLAPRYDIWVNEPGCMGADWGQPMHHEQLFRGTEAVREKLFAGVEAWRRQEPFMHRSIARVVNSPQEMFAMAGIFDPASAYAIEAFTMGDLSHMRSYTWDSISGRFNQMFCKSGEMMLFLPRMMYAAANSTRPDAAAVIGAGQAAPRTPTRPLRVVVRKDRDQPFKVHFNGLVKQKEGFDIQVFAPTGAQVAAMRVPTGLQTVDLTVPTDGLTGQYVVFIHAFQADTCYAPFTSLPEVYVTSFWTGDGHQSRFFTRSPTTDSVEMTFGPHQGPGVVLAADQRTVLAETQKGEPMKVSVGAEGVWVWNRSTYMAGSRGGDQPVILANTPDRWFMPDQQSLSLPAPTNSK